MPRFEITEGDTEPPLRVLLRDANDVIAAVQSGDVVTFRMRPVVPGLRDDIATPATVNDGPAGDVQYDWTVLDTAVPGVYEAEFHLARAAGGGQRTFPNSEFISVVIKDKASST